MFTRNECEDIISYRDGSPIKTTTGGYVGYDKIQYTGWDILNTPKTKWIFDILFEEFTKQTNIELVCYPDRFGLHRYVQGEMFARHDDTRDENRVWNVGTNLSDTYVGGDFVLYNPEVLLPKTPGQIYTFESAREHEVKEILNGERWSLIMFIWKTHIKKDKFI